MVFQHSCSSRFSLSLRNPTYCCYAETYLGSFFSQKYIYIDELYGLEKYCIVAEVLLKMSHFSKWFILLHAQRELVFTIIYVTLLSGCSSLGCELAKYQEKIILVCSNKEAVFGIFFFPAPPKGWQVYKRKYSHISGGHFLQSWNSKVCSAMFCWISWFEPLFSVEIVGPLLCLNSALAV